MFATFIALGEALTTLGGGETLRVAVEGGSTELPVPKDFRIIGTLNSFDRNYLNQISEALKRRFALDDEYLEDLKAELIQAKKLAVDEEGAVLVWAGNTQEPVARIGKSVRPGPVGQRELEDAMSP